jgi:hypothetical protein
MLLESCVLLIVVITSLALIVGQIALGMTPIYNDPRATIKKLGPFCLFLPIATFVNGYELYRWYTEEKMSGPDIWHDWHNLIDIAIIEHPWYFTILGIINFGGFLLFGYGTLVGTYYLRRSSSFRGNSN